MTGACHESERRAVPCAICNLEERFPCVHARRVLISARGINTHNQPPTICYSIYVEFGVPRKLFLEHSFHMSSTGKKSVHEEGTSSSSTSKKRKSMDTNIQSQNLRSSSSCELLIRQLEDRRSYCEDSIGKSIPVISVPETW